MTDSALIEYFEVRNDDVTIRFTCQNYGKRIRECADNLLIKDDVPETQIRKKAIFGQTVEGVEFRRGSGEWVTEAETCDWDAFFFENTDYPMHATARNSDVKLLGLAIGKEQVMRFAPDNDVDKERNLHVSAEDRIIFGSVNYRNQVGRTDIRVDYEKNGEPADLAIHNRGAELQDGLPHRYAQRDSRH